MSFRKNQARNAWRKANRDRRSYGIANRWIRRAMAVWNAGALYSMGPEGAHLIRYRYATAEESANRERNLKALAD